MATQRLRRQTEAPRVDAMTAADQLMFALHSSDGRREAAGTDTGPDPSRGSSG